MRAHDAGISEVVSNRCILHYSLTMLVYFNFIIHLSRSIYVMFELYIKNKVQWRRN